MAAKVSLHQQLEEVERELTLRRRVYERQVATRAMRQSEADFFMRRMEATRDTLLWLIERESLIKQRLSY